MPQFYAMMAQVLLLNRDPAGARDWIDRAIVLMQANADMYVADELHRLAARCERESGAMSEAGRHLRMAIDLAQSQRAKLFELRAALDLAEIDGDTANGRRRRPH